MLRLTSSLAAFFLLLAALLPLPAQAQGSASPTARLDRVEIAGYQTLENRAIWSLTGLEIGAQVSKDDLQAASDRLVATGLFADVRYEYKTHDSNLTVTYLVKEAPRVPVYFDNLPWLADSELSDVIRKKLSFYDGTLPESGDVVDQAAAAVGELVASHGIQATIEHQIIASPFAEGNVQEFRMEGPTLQIAKLEFGDETLTASKNVQQHVKELIGKPYSRLSIDLFLAEQIRPVYLKQGYLRVQLGPPEVRLTGNPNQKLPSEVPIFIPVRRGAIYKWKGASWTGNSTLSPFTLDGLLGLKPGEAADGMALEAGWDRVREEYGHRGFLEAALAPAVSYNEAARTVAYSVDVKEGPQFRFGEMVLTGLSASAERLLRAAWIVPPGEIFDKAEYEDLLVKLQTHPDRVFGELPVHFDEVGHWLRTDASKGVVDVLLDFK